MTHISKELAEWLKERGCKLDSQYIWNSIWKDQKDRLFELCSTEIVKHHPSLFYDEGYPAYSWYDILVTHAKEFWGEKMVNINDYGYGTAAYVDAGEALLYHLQMGETQEAEDYVKKHSLFAKQDL